MKIIHAAGIEYTGNWVGLPVGTEVQLEDASGVTGSSGYFGFNGKAFASEIGAGATVLSEGVDYNYDEYLDSVYIQLCPKLKRNSQKRKNKLEKMQKLSAKKNMNGFSLMASKLE